MYHANQEEEKKVGGYRREEKRKEITEAFPEMTQTKTENLR